MPAARPAPLAFGSAEGIEQRAAQYHQGLAGSHGAAETGNRLGTSLAVGDFDLDGWDDVAMGSPGQDNERGEVIVAFGTGDGLEIGSDRAWRKGESGVPGFVDRASGDHFGHALAAADFDRDGFVDLAIGEPGAVVLPGFIGHGKQGAVTVIYGSPVGLETGAGKAPFFGFQRNGRIPGDPNDGEAFGASLVVGHRTCFSLFLRDDSPVQVCDLGFFGVGPGNRIEMRDLCADVDSLFRPVECFTSCNGLRS